MSFFKLIRKQIRSAVENVDKVASSITTRSLTSSDANLMGSVSSTVNAFGRVLNDSGLINSVSLSSGLPKFIKSATSSIRDLQEELSKDGGALHSIGYLYNAITDGKSDTDILNKVGSIATSANLLSAIELARDVKNKWQAVSDGEVIAASEISSDPLTLRTSIKDNARTTRAIVQSVVDDLERIAGDELIAGTDAPVGSVAHVEGYLKEKENFGYTLLDSTKTSYGTGAAGAADSVESIIAGTFTSVDLSETPTDMAGGAMFGVALAKTPEILCYNWASKVLGNLEMTVTSGGATLAELGGSTFRLTILHDEVDSNFTHLVVPILDSTESTVNLPIDLSGCVLDAGNSYKGYTDIVLSAVNTAVTVDFTLTVNESGAIGDPKRDCETADLHYRDSSGAVLQITSSQRWVDLFGQLTEYGDPNYSVGAFWDRRTGAVPYNLVNVCQVIYDYVNSVFTGGESIDDKYVALGVTGGFMAMSNMKSWVYTDGPLSGMSTSNKLLAICLFKQDLRHTVEGLEVNDDLADMLLSRFRCMPSS